MRSVPGGHFRRRARRSVFRGGGKPAYALSSLPPNSLGEQRGGPRPTSLLDRLRPHVLLTHGEIPLAMTRDIKHVAVDIGGMSMHSSCATTPCASNAPPRPHLHNFGYVRRYERGVRCGQRRRRAEHVDVHEFDRPQHVSHRQQRGSGRHSMCPSRKMENRGRTPTRRGGHMESGFESWIVREFRHPVPSEYQDFLCRGVAAAYAESSTPSRAYLVTGDGDEHEVSEWFPAARIPDIYRRCRAEGLIAEHLLPIFDSCGCVAASTATSARARTAAFSCRLLRATLTTPVRRTSTRSRSFSHGASRTCWQP